MSDVSNGQERIRSWPRPRPKRTKAEIERQETFRAANMVAKWMAPEIVAQFNDAVRGTPLLPRDLIISMLYGRLAMFETDTAGTLYPMAARTAVSESLDALSNEEGSLLIRGPEFWEKTTLAQQLLELRGFCQMGLNGTTNTVTGAWSFVSFTRQVDNADNWFGGSPQRIRLPDVGIYMIGVRVRVTVALLQGVRLRTGSSTIAQVGADTAGGLYAIGGLFPYKCETPDTPIYAEIYKNNVATYAAGDEESYLVAAGPF